MSKRWKPPAVKEAELVADARTIRKKELARKIADKIANYYRGFLGMRISYDPERLWLFLEAIRDELMREVEHHPYVPKELRIEVAKGVSALAKSWDWIQEKEREGGFAWWLAIMAQLIEDEVQALDALGVTWEHTQGPLSDLPEIQDRKSLPEPTEEDKAIGQVLQELDGGSGAPPD